MSEIITIEAGSARLVSSPEVPADLRQLGKYRLVYRFATGGMANLYLARFAGPDGFEKLVAVKVIHDHLTADAAFVKMFVDEARLVSRITHPHVAQILELGRLGRTYYIAMEYVDGENVAALLRRTKPPIGCAARIIADAAAGLHAAHELRNSDGELFQVVHRDVSPQNILVTYSGATKVVDFGIAQARGMARLDAARLDESDAFCGKLGYMAPEQLRRRPVDRRADIFVLGIVLYELTTRRKLFRATAETLRQHVLEESIAPPSQLVDGYPRELEQVVLRALERDPDKRYQSAEAMQEAIENYIVSSGAPVLSTHVGKVMARVFADRIKKKQQLLRRIRDNTLDVLPRVDLDEDSACEVERGARFWLRRRWPLLAAGAAAMLCALLIIGYVLWRGERTPPTRQSPSASGTSLSRSASSASEVPSSGLAAQVRISIAVSPAAAAIRFGDRAVSNPFLYREAAQRGEVLVTASAAGRISKSFKVSLGKSSAWVITLGRTEGVAPAAAKRPRLRKRGRRHKELGDDDVLINPYR